MCQPLVLTVPLVASEIARVMAPDAVTGDTDDALVGRAQKGDSQAFSSLVERYQERWYGLALRMTGNGADAEEALQEALLQLYRNLGNFRGDARFTTWAWRIVVNAALMHRRSGKRHVGESLETYLPRFDDAGYIVADVPDSMVVTRADEVADQRELAQKALEGVSRLDDIYRTTFILRDIEELSTEEAAEVLGVEPTVVRVRLHRARLMLRGYLAKQLAGGES